MPGGVKVNMNKRKMMAVGRGPAARPQRGRYMCGGGGSELSLVPGMFRTQKLEQSRR